MADSDTESVPETVIASPEQVLDLLESHEQMFERKFRMLLRLAQSVKRDHATGANSSYSSDREESLDEKLQTIVESISITADDHVSATKQLKKVCKQYLRRKQTTMQPPQSIPHSNSQRNGTAQDNDKAASRDLAATTAPRAPATLTPPSEETTNSNKRSLSALPAEVPSRTQPYSISNHIELTTSSRAPTPSSWLQDQARINNSATVRPSAEQDPLEKPRFTTTAKSQFRQGRSNSVSNRADSSVSSRIPTPLPQWPDQVRTSQKISTQLVDYYDDDDDEESIEDAQTQVVNHGHHLDNDDKNDSLYDGDINHEEDDIEDIVHEELLHGSDIPPATAQSQTQLDGRTSTETAKPKKKQTVLARTTTSGQPPIIKWTHEEEECMIKIIYELFQDGGYAGTRTEMWKRAAQTHRACGYNRTYVQLQLKWSMSTRQKCAERGLTWAEPVMQKNEHIPRPSKKRPLSMDAAEAIGDDSGREARKKRVKKKSKKVPRAIQERTTLARRHYQQPGPHNKLQHQYTFKNASSAIVQVDWSPDGKFFAAASNSIVDESTDFDNNRPCNLIYGSLPSKTLRELPEHRTERKNALPQYLYQTVSAVKFGTDGRRLYSGGYDQKLRVWDVEDEAQIDCKTEYQYPHKRIEVMDVTGEESTVLATGTNSGTKSIRVFVGDSNLKQCQELWPIKDSGISIDGCGPTCLRFGKIHSKDMLLAGFGKDATDKTSGEVFGTGCIAVWRLAEAKCEVMNFDQAHTSFVSDCTWSAFGNSFVVGAVNQPMHKKESWEHSVVKLYSVTQVRPTTIFSCPARDINDVTSNSGLVTASCTYGCTYVWDERNPAIPLHVLAHAEPVEHYDTPLERELNDVGVRYAEWAGSKNQLYTGGSDGLLLLWDTRRAPADAQLQVVADIGHEILCGKFSPDKSSLLLGDENRQLHLFSNSDHGHGKDDFAFRVAERWARQ